MGSTMGLAFDYGIGEAANWIIAETSHDLAYTGKVESLFALGNGYMGVRAAAEERCASETRGFYIAGVYDAFPGEVTELANLPDWLSLEIEVEGERINCISGRFASYLRTLDLRTGSVCRFFEWQSSSGKRVRLRFERFLSMRDRHCGALRVFITPVNFRGTVVVRSGINGQVNNGGVQHLREGQLRLFPGSVIASISRTQESNIGVCVAADHDYSLDGMPFEPVERVRTGRRRIEVVAEGTVGSGQTLSVTKYAAAYTGRDPDRPAGSGTDDSALLDSSLAALDRSARCGYEAMFSTQCDEWQSIWKRTGVEIDGPNFDQLAVRFALFHILQMTPRNDPSVSIAAKGFTGEGYKGHVFWDTEIFLMPFFNFTLPGVASRLLSYRFKTLDGARGKARAHGYRGAMYAWESAADGSETTPPFSNVDIVSGRQITIWSGEIEQHISVDIPYAVWKYYLTSGDDRFMIEKGLEIIFETARFWADRLEWKAETKRYEITDVIGPDEYGEHVNNNAYTNFLVRWHLGNSAELYDHFAAAHPEALARLSESLSLDESERALWKEKAERLFVNIDWETGFVHQYDGFTKKQAIDLSRYRDQVGAVTDDYGWAELMQSQVVKQADTIMLLYLRGEDFSVGAKRLNWDYYEPKTLHDSSLSHAVHSILASDIGEKEKAYDYFSRAARIDLGPEPSTSDSGVHAASLGGIWQAVVNGFAGVRVTEPARLEISPRLPVSWKRLSFPLVWRGQRLHIMTTASRLSISGSAERGKAFEVEVDGTVYTHPGAGTLEIARNTK